MRPVDRSSPAVNTYPPDYNSLSPEQKAVVQFLYSMLFETKTAKCDQWATQLGAAYDIDLEQIASSRMASGISGPWTTVAELDTVYDKAQKDYNNRPSPPDPNDPMEVSEMTDLYKTLKGISAQKPSIVEYYKDKVEQSYSRARRQLILNIGQYCSYCELPLAASLAVEHMLPKSEFPQRSLVWTNFLLACPICNSYKNNKPSRPTGVALSPNLGAHQPPVDPQSPPTDQEEQWIIDAAQGSYLWPSDAANYNAFQNFFQYRMVKVIYDAVGNLITEETIDASTLNNWMKDDRIKLESDTGNAVLARVSDQLYEFQPNPSTQIMNDWQQGTINAQLLQGLQNQRFVLDPAVASLGKIVKETIDNDNFKITERRKYYIDLSGNPKKSINVQVSEVDPTDANGVPQTNLFIVSLTKDEQGVFRQRLASGRLPDQLQTEFAKLAYQVDVLKDVVTVENQRNAAYVTIEKIYALHNNAGNLQLFGLYTLQVELRLVAAANQQAANAQANQVINDLKLNNINASLQANKRTDRRMIKRTRTWFVALETVQRLYQTLNATPPAAPYTELLSMVAETAKATGFWTVWWSVFYQALSPIPTRTGVMQFLSDANNFPGTR